jgi:hypothetical protein
MGGTGRGQNRIAYKPASAETISSDGGPPRQWAETRMHLERSSTYWLATMRPEGGHHLVPVLAVWVDGALHFAASDTTRKAKDLEADSRCVLAVAGDGLDLVVEGRAAQVSDEATLRRVAASGPLANRSAIGRSRITAASAGQGALAIESPSATACLGLCTRIAST